MRVSARAEYACIAVLELAANYHEGRPVRIKSIADAHGIPARYLVQILIQLKGAGYVVSTRGSAGGYQLAKPPEEITLGEIMSAIDGPLRASVEPGASSGSPALRILTDVWQDVASAERQVLEETSIAELADRLRESAHEYHI